MYRGIQGVQDFGQPRDKPEDPSDLENQLVWSTCRPHQVQAVLLLKVAGAFCFPHDRSYLTSRHNNRCLIYHYLVQVIRVGQGPE